MFRRLSPIAVALSFLLAAPPARAHDWNAKQIHWVGFTQGLKLARKKHKPICLIIFTEWCPHCRNYATVFHDPRVVREARKFVMIHVDKDKHPDISRRFAPDGEYIPRTYFLDYHGDLHSELRAPQEQYSYFYDELDPRSILAGMKRAAKALH